MISFGSNATVGADPTETADSVLIEFVPEVSYDLVEDRLRCLERTVPLNFNSRVFGFVNYFVVKEREYSKMVIGRAPVYFPLMEKYLDKYDLPQEIKYLSIVESGLNPRAVSRAGAVGLWQFMPSTGRYYGLHQDWYIDQRMDPERSTEAACKYIRQLYGIFKDWELALAAYNCGPGNVRRAIRRSGYKKTFWEIYRYLPRETRSYLPQFVAILYLLNHGEDHNFFVDAEPKFNTATVTVSHFLHLETFSNQLNICSEDLAALNPAIKRGALPDATRDFELKIPEDIMEEFQKNREEILDSARRTGKKEIEYLARNSAGSTWGRERVVHRVKSGEVLGLIAQKYRVRVSDIRNWNGLSGNLIRVGQRLNIWLHPGSRTRPDPKPPKTQVVAKTTAAPKAGLPKDSKIHYVKPGDTLWDISRMYQDLTVDKIKKLNNLKTNRIDPGQTLLIG